MIIDKSDVENLLPIGLKKIFSIDFYFDKLISYCGTNLIIKDEEKDNVYVELDNDTVYLIIDNLYFTHFWHYNLEIILHLQLYLNYFKEKVVLNKYKFKFVCKPNVFIEFKKELFEILSHDDMLIVEQSTCFKGKFFSISVPDITFLINHIHNSISGVFCLSIYDKLIEESNKRYKETEKFDKLWISRRNFDIKTYWHKRFITNLNEVAPFILENGFNEIHFPIENIYRQIYLVNNSNVIFSEVGTSMVNIFFMKKGSTFIVDFDPTILPYNNYIKLIAELRGINLVSYDKMISDCETAQFYNLKIGGDLNVPYKFEDPDDFKLWFDKVLKSL